jgi:hypothetical protein
VTRIIDGASTSPPRCASTTDRAAGREESDLTPHAGRRVWNPNPAGTRQSPCGFQDRTPSSPGRGSRTSTLTSAWLPTIPPELQANHPAAEHAARGRIARRFVPITRSACGSALRRSTQGTATPECLPRRALCSIESPWERPVDPRQGCERSELAELARRAAGARAWDMHALGDLRSPGMSDNARQLTSTELRPSLKAMNEHAGRRIGMRDRHALLSACAVTDARCPVSLGPHATGRRVGQGAARSRRPPSPHRQLDASR